MEVLLLSSKALNEDFLIKEFEFKIIELFKTIGINKTDKLKIGNIHNGNTIKFLEELGYNIIVHKQHPRSVGASNQKLIKEYEIIVFFRYKNSKNITYFIDYAKSYSNSKSIFILDLP